MRTTYLPILGWNYTGKANPIDAVSSSVSWSMNNKSESTWREAVIVEFNVLPSHFPGRTEEKHVSLSQDSRSPSQHLYPVPHEYETGVLTTQPRRQMTSHSLRLQCRHKYAVRTSSRNLAYNLISFRRVLSVIRLKWWRISEVAVTHKKTWIRRDGGKTGMQAVPISPPALSCNM